MKHFYRVLSIGASLLVVASTTFPATLGIMSLESVIGLTGLAIVLAICSLND